MSNDPNCPFGTALTPEAAIEVDRAALAHYREFVGEWHTRAQAAGFDGVATLLDHVQTAAASDVLIERARQVITEGWTPAHDDEHDDGSLAKAAACYALHTEPVGNVGDYLRFWPWDGESWKPGARRRNLIKAAALILAEIERLDRAAANASSQCA